MKKLLLSLAFLGSFAAFAQKDLQITMNNPTAGQNIVAGSPFTVSFSLKNAGTIDIPASDSVTFGVVVSNNVVYAANVNHGGLTVGQTKDLTVNGFTLNFTTGASNVQFCVVATLRYNGNLDSNMNNNINCASVNMTLTGIEESQAASSLKVYPNPASGLVHFEYNYNKSSVIRVFDLTGKQMIEIPANEGAAKLDVSNFSNGLYIYEIHGEDNSVIKSGRFNVAH